MRLRSFSVSFFAAAVVVALSAGAAAAGGCLKDTRQTKVDQSNVARLLGYLCTSDQDAQTRVRVQFQRLSGLATGVVLNGGSAPWLSALYGNYQVANNDVLKEYKTLIEPVRLRRPGSRPGRRRCHLPGPAGGHGGASGRRRAVGNGARAEGSGRQVVQARAVAGHSARRRNAADPQRADLAGSLNMSYGGTTRREHVAGGRLIVVALPDRGRREAVRRAAAPLQRARG